ncbi:MAG: TonB-dependent receptor [Lutibacter sp.]
MKNILTILLLFTIITVQSQNGSIKGKVTNQHLQAIPYATIVLKTTSMGTTTNEDGSYTLTNINPGSYTVQFSAIGYKSISREINLKSSEEISISVQLADDLENLNEVVISASRNPEYLSEIPASISVVNSTQLKEFAKATTNVSDILAVTVPGLAVSTGTFSNWGQTLRGRSLLVMVDGIPQSTPLRNGQLEINSIQPNDISRVEVIKGATSIFGNGGNGGFINYITKDPSKLKNIEGATNIWGTSNFANSEDAMGYGIYQSLTGKVNKFNYYISGSLEKTGNKYDAKGKPLLPTYGLDNTDIQSTYGKLEYNLSENQKLTLNGNYYKSDQKTPFIPVDAVVQVFNEEGDYSIEPGYGIKGTIPGEKPTGSTITNGRLKYDLVNIFAETTSFETDIYYSKVKNIFFYSDKFENGGQSIINSEKYGLRPNFNTQIQTYENLDISLTYGLDLFRDKTNQGLLDGRLWVPNTELINWAPYLQTTFKLNNEWVIKGGLRYDDMKMDIVDYNTLPYSPKSDGNFNPSISVKGGTLNFNNLAFNIGARYIANQEFIPYISYSQGFSIADLGSVLRSAQAESIDDIQLEPAVTDNYEFGFLSKFNKFRFEAVGYYSTSNLGTGVVLDEELNSFVPSKNPQKIFGGEISIDYIFQDNKWLIGASYSYVEGLKSSKENKNEFSYLGGDVIAAPKLTAYINWNPTEKISTSLTMVNLGDRNRFDPIQGSNGNWAFKHTEFPVTGYTLLNLTMAYNIQPDISVSLGINNLLNEYYLPARSQWAAPLKSFTGAGEGTNVKLSVNYYF